MNKQDFLKLIKDPSQVTSADSDKLEEVIANFPYCQAAHILIAKISHQNSSMLAKQKLNKAAAYVLERQKLKKIINLQVSSPELPIKSETTIKNEHVHSDAKSDLVQPEVQNSPASADIPIAAVQSEEKHADEEKPPLQIEIQKSTPVEHSSADTPISFEQSSSEEVPVSKDNGKKDQDLKSTFFKELEQNLQNLKKLKEKNELRHFIEEGVKPEIVISPPDVERFQAFDPAPIPSPEIQVKIVPETQRAEKESAEFTIYSSRLEDILIQPDISMHSAPQELLLDYIGFLANRKKVFFRSREKVNDIIEKFISEEPSIPYSTIDESSETVEDLSEDSSRVSNHIASENFAKILVRQGKYKKAISIYNELILKNPEKKAYFAFQIQTLNNKIQ